MKKTNNESVVSIDLSRKLLEQLRAEKQKTARTKRPFLHMPLAPIMHMKGRYERITLQTKWGWRWRGCAYCGHDRRLEYTGGVSLTVSLPSPSYGGFGASKTWRLAPGWKTADYDRMVYRATTWGIRELRVLDYRELVELTFNALPEGTKDTAQAHAEQAGWPVMYSEMSVDACEQWLEWLKKESK